MPPDTPDRCVALLVQPLVTKVLCVVVVNLKAAVVNVARRIGAHEEGMVVHRIITSIDVREYSDVLRLLAIRTLCICVRERYVKEIRGRQVEIARVPLELTVKVLYTQPVVTEFVHRGGTWCKAIELPHARLVRFVVHDDLGGQVALWRRLLSVDQIDGEAFRIV